jgi:hypothetical protein
VLSFGKPTTPILHHSSTPLRPCHPASFAMSAFESITTPKYLSKLLSNSQNLLSCTALNRYGETVSTHLVLRL